MISIVIVGYNSRQDLKDCFDSLFTSSYKRFKIIYVDNGSSDGSYQFVKDNYSKVIAIKNKNTGYAGGNNVGIKYALKHNMSKYPYRSSLPARRSFNEVGSRTNFSIPRLSAVHSKNKTDKANTRAESHYVFILNPDTIVDKDCLKILAQKADRQTIVQPLILLNIKGKNTRQINTTGSYLNFLGFSYCNNYRLDQNTAKEVEIGLSSGAAVLIAVDIIKKIGLLDENFFMYHEDVDWFYRARLNGFKIWLVPSAIVYHNYSFSKNKNKFFYSERNRLLFLYKNFTLKYLALIFPIFLINELLIILYSALNGWFLLKIKSYLSILKLLKQEGRGRRRNLILAKSMEKQNKQFIGSKISFSEVKNPLFLPYNLLLKLYFKIIYLLI